MLRKISVDGFRSLLSFTIELERGLNVIVGTNGTGKTNFVSFLDFIGEMVDVDLNSAIAVSQGAGAVFSIEKFQTNSAELDFTLSGDIDTNSLQARYLFYRHDAEQRVGSYSYSAQIKYLRDVPAVLIRVEQLDVRVESFPALQLKRTTDHDGSNFKSLLEFTPPDHPLLRTLYAWHEDIKKGSSAAEIIANRLVPEQSILKFLMGSVDVASAIVADLTGLRSINIDPSLARLPTPVGVGQDIGPKGEGLAGALYRLEKGNYHGNPMLRFTRRYLRPDIQSSTYRSILSWCREVNPGVDDVKVELDFHEALFRPFLTFKRRDKIERFSLSRISDGTVKWLSLVAVLHIEPSLSTIEEPENFLHPFMQESFISLCRRLIEDDPFRNFIISTHSPTLLDCCEPREMIIFELDEGITRASKVANRNELAKKIENSRFGLGYYYRTGGVYGADRSDS